MKAGKYGVVVQWGGGHIYFIGFHSTQKRAQNAANLHSIYLGNSHKKKRGAKPEVMVWKKLTTGMQLIEGPMR